MAHYRRVGEIPAKRHTQFRRPDGGLYSEELMGEEGFSSDAALLYHRGVPSALVDARPWELPDPARPAHAPLLMRMRTGRSTTLSKMAIAAKSARSGSSRNAIAAPSPVSITTRSRASRSASDAASVSLNFCLSLICSLTPSIE